MKEEILFEFQGSSPLVQQNKRLRNNAWHTTTGGKTTAHIGINRASNRSFRESYLHLGKPTKFRLTLEKI